MANPVKGEVSFEVEDETYTLNYDANALCELEDLFDRSFIEIAQEMESWGKRPQKLRLTVVRGVFWAGLQKHHPDMTLQDAGELVIKAGGAFEIMETISQGFERAFPAGKTKGTRPPRKAGGTGKGSTPAGSKSD